MSVVAKPKTTPAQDIIPLRRALLSVSDKAGLVDFANALVSRGVHLLSTGGTAKTLRDAGLPVTDVSDHTGFPEILDGRVKTLHPKIHGGLLAIRDDADHAKAMQDHGIETIDLLVVNLYPFRETVAKGADYDNCVENIDIGGPAMIRAAAKNHAFVSVVTNPADYSLILADLDQFGGTQLKTRQTLAGRAYANTAAYDAAISAWFVQQQGVSFPQTIALSGQLREVLRYGENPHQSAAVYSDHSGRAGVVNAVKIQGKELSYNNLNDTDAAFELVSEFTEPAVAIIKHANPSGVAVAGDVLSAYHHALACDPVSAFGGIIALNRALNAKTAEEILKVFSEVIIAPEILDEALPLLAKKPNIRVLATGTMPSPADKRLYYKPISGGLLVQDNDTGCIGLNDLKVVTKRTPTEAELQDLLFAFRVCKHVKSNAIVYVKDGRTLGIGAGQMSRIDSTRIAAIKAADAHLDTKGSVVASDAFFPFADGLITAAEAGVTAVIQPGGSMRDQEVIDAANERGLAMVFTGMRHFRH